MPCIAAVHADSRHGVGKNTGKFLICYIQNCIKVCVKADTSVSFFVNSEYLNMRLYFPIKSQSIIHHKEVILQCYWNSLRDNLQEFWINKKNISKMSFCYYYIAKALRSKCYGKRFWYLINCIDEYLLTSY